MQVKEITIKSEMDSRVLLYPLMRFLAPLGSCLIITSNTFVSRIIEGEHEGDFKNFKILLDLEGATDDILSEYGINIEDFSTVVYDNVSVVEQDYLLIPIGPYVSEAFEEEMLMLGRDETTHIIKFGKDIKSRVKQEKAVPTSAPKAKKQKGKPELSEDDELERALQLEIAAVNKFKGKEIDVRADIRKLPNMKMPTYEEWEKLEGQQVFADIDKNIFKMFFGIFKDIVAYKEPMYLREVNRKDANSSNLKPRPTNG